MTRSPRDVAQQQTGDEVTRQDEEDVDPDEASANRSDAGVEQRRRGRRRSRGSRRGGGGTPSAKPQLRLIRPLVSAAEALGGRSIVRPTRSGEYRSARSPRTCAPESSGMSRQHEEERERVTGIEPAFSAWEADVLPLNYTRGRTARIVARNPAKRRGSHTRRVGDQRRKAGSGSGMTSPPRLSFIDVEAAAPIHDVIVIGRAGRVRGSGSMYPARWSSGVIRTRR